MKTVKTAKRYETKKCSSCNGKGIVKTLVETPGEFNVNLNIAASFRLEWDDAGYSTARQIEHEVRDVFARTEFLDLLEDELNAAVEKLTYKLKVLMLKLKLLDQEE